MVYLKYLVYFKLFLPKIWLIRNLLNYTEILDYCKNQKIININIKDY